jgi:hypothetical protein
VRIKHFWDLLFHLMKHGTNTLQYIHYIYKSMWTSLQKSGFGATPVAVRCIKSSTQLCNLHRQTLAVEWSDELSDFQRGTVIGCHLYNKSVCKISALLDLPRSTVNAVIVKWKRLVETMAQPMAQPPSAEARRYHPRLQHSKFQTASGSNVSTTTIRRELHAIGFHGRAAMPKIIMCNVKHLLEWCKARHHWTLE